MATVHVFIDTNVLLSFYHYTKDDAAQLESILKAIAEGQLRLYITSQVIEEYNRNREVKLAAAIKDFEKGGKAPGIPRCMIEYPEAKAYREAAAAIETTRSALVNKAKMEAEVRSLSTDNMFQKICDAAEHIERTEEIILAAQQRKSIGNPPGKKDSLGDQINWECLLAGVPASVDLHIVSKDGDFASPLFVTRPHQYLIDEWKNRNGGGLTLYEEISAFLKAESENLKSKGQTVPVVIDVEKSEAIERLEKSRAFAITHSAIATLAPLIGALTWSEADRLLKAGVDNNQISWIGTDPDVYHFYRNLIEAFKHNIEPSRISALEDIFHAD